MEIKFDKKTALITGAAGYLGQEIAKQYADSGIERLVLVDRPERADALREVAESLKTRCDTEHYCVDIRDVKMIEGLAESLDEKGIRIDILINNAGINVPTKAVELPEEVWDIQLGVNLKGSFFMAKEIAKQSLIEQKGNIVFISSQHGIVGNIMRAAYCASKTGLLGLTRALVAEWSAYGVRVNSVAPTFILNEVNEKMLNDSQNVRSKKNKIPLRRYAQAEDVANAVLFISSDKAAMINGHALAVDGGYTVL